MELTPARFLFVVTTTKTRTRNRRNSTDIHQKQRRRRCWNETSIQVVQSNRTIHRSRLGHLFHFLFACRYCARLQRSWERSVESKRVDWGQHALEHCTLQMPRKTHLMRIQDRFKDTYCGSQKKTDIADMRGIHGLEWHSILIAEKGQFLLQWCHKTVDKNKDETRYFFFLPPTHPSTRVSENTQCRVRFFCILWKQSKNRETEVLFSTGAHFVVALESR